MSTLRQRPPMHPARPQDRHPPTLVRPQVGDVLPLEQLLQLLPGEDKDGVRRWLFTCLEPRPLAGVRHAFAWSDLRQALVRLRAFLPGGPLDGPWLRGPRSESEAETLRRWSRAFRWSPEEPLTTWITLREAALIRGTGARKCLRDLALARLPAPLEVMTGRRLEERGVRLYDVVMADRVEQCFGLPTVANEWRPLYVPKARPDGWDPDRDRVPGQPSPTDPDAARLLASRLIDRIRREKAPVPTASPLGKL